jgi:Tol biopolymer transport system component
MPGADGQSDIRIIDLKTRQVSRVTDSVGKFSPRWSPDGRYLAALEFQFSSFKKLYLFDFQTGKWSDWITDADGIGYPSWTPDNRYVVYGASQSIKRIRVGNSHPEVLFSLKGLAQYLTEAGAWTNLAPDGSSMFIRDTSTQDIYSLDVDFP